ncbi:hypothetical protein FH063_004238 [Azospirillum argentinense]|uniref:Uncharacterized protein n=1 Tax=Azospirillum argentinense TaxID=2970906 RepID=A0A5B0KIV4_9PROT|nr:hypothetical protein FH063_004238 [Azospirillum argentinense]
MFFPSASFPLPSGERVRVRGMGFCRTYRSRETPSPSPLPRGERVFLTLR